MPRVAAGAVTHAFCGQVLAGTGARLGRLQDARRHSAPKVLESSSWSRRGADGDAHVGRRRGSRGRPRVGPRPRRIAPPGPRTVPLTDPVTRRWVQVRARSGRCAVRVARCPPARGPDVRCYGTLRALRGMPTGCGRRPVVESARSSVGLRRTAPRGLGDAPAPVVAAAVDQTGVAEPRGPSGPPGHGTWSNDSTSSPGRSPAESDPRPPHVPGVLRPIVGRSRWMIGCLPRDGAGDRLCPMGTSGRPHGGRLVRADLYDVLAGVRAQGPRPRCAPVSRRGVGRVGPNVPRGTLHRPRRFLAALFGQVGGPLVPRTTGAMTACAGFVRADPGAPDVPRRVRYRRPGASPRRGSGGPACSELSGVGRAVLRGAWPARVRPLAPVWRAGQAAAR